MSILQEHYLFLRNLDTELIKSIKTYTTSEYKVINKELRSGKSLTQKTQKIVNHIDQVFEMIEPITEPLVLYRGVREKEITPDKAFISATYDKNVAESFSSLKCCVIVFNIPVGSKVLFIESISDSPDELEVLIDRHGSFSITAIREAKVVGEKDLIYASYLPPKSIKVEENFQEIIEDAKEQLDKIQRVIDIFSEDEYEMFKDDLDDLIRDTYKSLYNDNKLTISMIKNIEKKLRERFGE